MASYFYQPLSFPVQKQYIRVHRAGVAEKPPESDSHCNYRAPPPSTSPVVGDCFVSKFTHSPAVCAHQRVRPLSRI